MPTQSRSMPHARSAEHGETSLGPVSVAFVILGQCYSLKNSKMLSHGRTIKNPKATAFEEDFVIQVPPSAKRSIGGQKMPLRAIVTVYYPSYRQDLDCAIVYDMLQKTGVVSNDRWIREKHEFAEVDTANPRVEITIEEM